MSTAPLSKTKAQPMCCVAIGYQHFLMPSADGLKVMQLLQQASECERSYENGGYVYAIKEPAEVKWSSVNHSQVRLREIDPHAPRRSAAKPTLLIGSGS